MSWQCGIDGCGTVFADLESMVAHQTNDHTHHECQVCGTVVPDGYLAISHAFSEHTRAEYVRAYDASAAAVRERETLLEEIGSLDREHGPEESHTTENEAQTTVSTDSNPLAESKSEPETGLGQFDR